ncbi:X-linked retinitis pigmentosa GTPase regulator-interacting protein 1 [Rhizophlyctis rosea]|nr:X-linked retinitis pigmentosa GTPase regulator-interacting protein 1 [Rhizophlyctis rosea]
MLTDLPGLHLRPDILSDEVYHLKDENINLKKKLNEQDDKAKRLVAKVQRLSEDLQKVKSSTVSSGTTSANSAPHLIATGPIRNAGVVAATSRKDVIEAYDLVDDLRNQMRTMSKENMQLKNKMNFFRAMHEAETRKRTAYDHIPPRINSGVQKRLYPAITVRTVRKPQPHAVEPRQPEPPPMNPEEIEKLEEIITNLRRQLIATEKEVQDAREDNRRLQEGQESQQHQNDMDRLALQRELGDIKQRYADLRTKFDSLDERFRVQNSAHEQAMQTINDLNAELKEERNRNLELEHNLRAVEIRAGGEKDLNIIISDLRAEIRLLEQEQARLLQNQFGLEREDEWNKEREALKRKIRELEGGEQKWLEEKQELLKALQEARAAAAAAQKDSQEANAKFYNLQHELDKLKEQLRLFNWKDGEIDLSEIEEALAMLRLCKEKGTKVDFLERSDDKEHDKRLLQDLRLQYAECVQELEKTAKLLALQEKINRDYKLEVEDLNRKLVAMRNEYELRLEEDSRLLDLRGHKIATLEAQLKNLAYGTTKVPQITAESQEEIELEKGTAQRL